MTGVLFPVWQIDRRAYDVACAYLGLTPDADLYERLSRYLAEAPFRFPRPTGFARYLAGLRLGPWTTARLDLATRLFMPDHPIRHILNGVLALHECTPTGYRELATSPRGFKAWLSLFGWTLAFGANVVVTAPWLGWQFLNHLVRSPFRGLEDLAGKRALVTGVSRGLGRDLLLHCLECGAEVIGVVRTRDAADDLRRQLPGEAPVTLLVADLATPGALVDALRQAQIAPESVSLAIACAAVKREGHPVHSLPHLRDTFQVNVFSAAELAHWLCRTEGGAVDALPVRGSVPAAALVLVSSMGRWHGMHSTCGYNASKAALSIWGESLEMELRLRAPRRISVTLVEPGLFASDMTRPTPINRLLFAPRRGVARRIVSAGIAGRRAIRPPFWFAVLTWGLCLAGRDIRYRIFARVKPGPDRQ